jgi:hypothetical protein
MLAALGLASLFYGLGFLHVRDWWFIHRKREDRPDGQVRGVSGFLDQGWVTAIAFAIGTGSLVIAVTRLL